MERQTYLDRIKVGLTALVVLHHTLITYGAPGGWYYREPAQGMAAVFPLTLLVAVNQSFFMGLFFFLSAYFVPSSLKRKGTRLFLKDRLLRLGIPLIFYSLVFSPLLNYLVDRHSGEANGSYLHYLSGYHHWIDFGVLWFVAALLLFTLLYLLLKNLSSKIAVPQKLPGIGGLVLLVFGLVLVTFVVRLLFPVGWSLRPLGFQLGHFPQYILLFGAGIAAGHNGYLEQLDRRRARPALVAAIMLIVLGFPSLMSLYLLQPDSSLFNGGWHLQNLAYAFWEQSTGISIILTLLYCARKLNGPLNRFTAALSRSAFAVYIFHPLVLITLSLAAAGWAVSPLVKLLVVAPLAVIGSFVLGRLVVLIPRINQII